MIKSSFGFKYLIIAILYLYNPHILYNQQLDHRLGQFIVQLQPDIQIDKFCGQQNIKRSSTTIFPMRCLSKAWNMWLIGFDHIKINENQLLQSLNLTPGVANIQKNRILSMRRIPNDPYFKKQWQHFNDGTIGGKINSDFDTDLAWDISTGGLTEEGDSIVVCVIDDGLDLDHSDIKANLWRNYAEIPLDGIDNDGNGYTDDYLGWNTYTDTDIFDSGNHGTPVCGLAAAAGNNQNGICAVNWSIKLMFVEGGGDEANAISAYSYPWWFRKEYNRTNGAKGAFVVVASSSWGLDYGKPEDAPVWCAIYASLGTVGILSAAATSNANTNVDIEGDLPTSCPSDYLITVTNMNWNNQKEVFAAYGLKTIDLGAYGENVLSLSPGNNYNNFSGTSAASPQVAAAIAFLYAVPCSNLSHLSKIQPSAAAREIKSILLNSVKQQEELKTITTSGGVLNIFQAANAVLPIEIIPSKNDLLIHFTNGNLVYPLIVEIKEKNDTSWRTFSMNSGNQIDINSLKACEEYTIRFKGICERYRSEFTQSRTIRTLGCCDAPQKIRTNGIFNEQVNLLFDNVNLSGEIGILRRIKGSEIWDSFRIFTILGEAELKGLYPCTQYEVAVYSKCEQSVLSPISEILTFTTNGCGTCSSRNYCQRNRPSGSLEWIESVTFDGKEFISGSNSGYGNFIGTNESWRIIKNNVHQLKVRPGYFALDSSPLNITAFVDFNQNSQFDTNESLSLTAIKTYTEAVISFLVPNDAKSGFTRLRIVAKYAGLNIPPGGPCDPSPRVEFGEYEDYCVWIQDKACGILEGAQVIDINTNIVRILLDNPNNEIIQYKLHKQKELNYETGFSDMNQIEITDLDSCSTYEIELKTFCSATSSILKLIFKTTGTSCAVGTNNSSFQAISLYPNPVYEFINILTPYELISQNDVRIKIMNLSGKAIIQEKLMHPSEKINIQFLKPGIYYYSISNDKGYLKNGKLIKI
ncbi:MAG: S8 family peptidase [Bacteroidota bacterium]|nr:S8 family peptidase [Bacteroidota bacterium]